MGKKISNKTDRCYCRHKRKDHSKYIDNGKNKKGSRYVCNVNGCSEWTECDLL